MATKVARKPTAAKAARKSKSKSASSASKMSGMKKTKSKMLSKTRATSKAKKAIAPKKSASPKSRATPRSTSRSNKMNEVTNDARMSSQSQEESGSMTTQAKMKLSRRNPKTFREEQSIQSNPDSVNPATRR